MKENEIALRKIIEEETFNSIKNIQLSERDKEKLTKGFNKWWETKIALNHTFGYTTVKLDMNLIFDNVWKKINLNEKEMLISKKLITTGVNMSEKLLKKIFADSDLGTFEMLISKKILNIIKPAISGEILEVTINKINEFYEYEKINDVLYDYVYITQDEMNREAKNKVLEDKMSRGSANKVLIDYLLKTQDQSDLEKYALIIPKLQDNLKINKGEDVFLEHEGNYFSLDVDYNKIAVLTKDLRIKDERKSVSLWINAFLQEYTAKNKYLKKSFADDYCLGDFGYYKKIMIVFKDGLKINMGEEKQKFKKCVNKFVKEMNSHFGTYTSDIKERKAISRKFLDAFNLNEELSEKENHSLRKTKINKI